MAPVTGLVAGGLIGDSEDKEAKENSGRQVAYEQNLRARQARAVTNSDVVSLVQGVGDDIICNEIRTRGGNFDTSPQAIYLQRAESTARLSSNAELPRILTPSLTATRRPFLKVGPTDFARNYLRRPRFRHQFGQYIFVFVYRWVGSRRETGSQEFLSPRKITLSSMSGNRYHWEFKLN